MEEHERRGDAQPQDTDGGDPAETVSEGPPARSDRPASARPYSVVETYPDGAVRGDVEERAIEVLGDDEIVQISVNLRGAEVKALQGVAGRYGTNLTEALRRCIATQHWMDHQRSGGASLYLEGPGRRRRRVVFR